MSDITREDKVRLLELLREQDDRIKYNKLKHYKPYGKQVLFHNLSTKYTERCLMAGNQLGKSLAGSMEAAYHTTGLYPDWWEGKKFNRPNVGWACGVTGEVVRDTVQRLLLGRFESGDIGIGSIPKDHILGLQRGMGTPNLLDHIKIKHISGGTSIINLKSYTQGREKFQGDTIDWVWFDEEPDRAVYTEGLTRTNASGQFAWLTYTPLLGMSETTHSFLEAPHSNQVVINMTIEDVDHYSEEAKASIIASYPAHEREARIKGIPTLGEGRIFPVSEESLYYEELEVRPEYWHIGGLDFGWNHPQAGVHLIWDKDNDVIYVDKAFRKSECTPAHAALTYRHWGENIPWAWPHDGYQHDKGSGDELAGQYRSTGMQMLRKHATHESGGNGVEAGLLEMNERMASGRLKIRSSLKEWWEEFRLYHRKDGKIVKERDDLMAATRYAIMMKRFAEQDRGDDVEEYENWKQENRQGRSAYGGY